MMRNMTVPVRHVQLSNTIFPSSHSSPWTLSPGHVRFQSLSSRWVSTPPSIVSLQCIPRSIRGRQAHSGEGGQQYRSQHQLSTRPDSLDHESFRYTTGRWLWDEEQQLCDRYRRFNVPKLRRIAAASLGARECVSMKKLAEGSFNKVFRLVMDNGRVAIARIPNPNAGPPYYTTASEVATMDLVRIPNLYAGS